MRGSSRKELKISGGETNKKATSGKAQRGIFSSPLRSTRSNVGKLGGKERPASISSVEDSSSPTEERLASSKRMTRGSTAKRGNKNGTDKGPPERVTRSKARTVTLGSESEDDADHLAKLPASVSIDGVGEAETSGDEITVNPSSKIRRSTTQPRWRQSTKRPDGLDDFVVDLDSDSDSGSGSDVRIVSEQSRRRRAGAFGNDDGHGEDEDDDEEDVPITPRKRLGRSKPKPKTPRQATEQDRQDLEEDLEFLQSSDDDQPEPTSRTTTRDEGARQKMIRAKALDMLKKRRAGQKITVSDSADEQDDTEMGNQNDRTIDFGNEYNSEDLDDQTAYHRHNGMPSSSATAMFEEDEDDEGFVIEDGEDTLGAPAAALPLQFSGLTSRKPKELFKFAVEWFVQKKFNPAFQMDDDVYRLTFDKLNDEVKGLVGSKFMSAAWTADFTRAVQARPNIEAHQLPKGSGFLHDKCDACNRSGHPATWQVHFTGKPYHEESLEDVEQEHDGDDDDDDDDDEEDSDDAETASWKVDVDSKGRPIPSAKRSFEVGKFCMQNARIGHALAHWRYHLNEWVIDYLRDEGYLSPDKIVERDGWNTRKRRDFANSVVDHMEERGEIKRLHRDYRNEIDTAREAKAADRFSKF